jgi:hypothetical protein
MMPPYKEESAREGEGGREREKVGESEEKKREGRETDRETNTLKDKRHRQKRTP